MQILHLLVEDDYIETFVNELSKDRVRIIEKEFIKNRSLLQDALDNYTHKKDSVKLYSESMKELTLWLNAREKST